MEQQKKERFWNKKWFLWSVVIFFGVGILGTLTDSKNTYTPTNTAAVTPTEVDSFASKARARFDDILKVSPELASIKCEDDCSSVYFDYKTLPEDLNFIIRGNAATFSKFRLDNTGTSHVIIMARLDGKVVMMCTASKGMVELCK